MGEGEHSPRDRHRRRTGPRVVATGRAARRPAAEPAGAADHIAQGGRAEARRRRRRDRDRDARRPALASAARPPRPRRGARGGRPADRRGGDGDGQRALGQGAPDPAPQPAPGRGGGRRYERADEGGLVQPGLPGRAAAPWDPAAAERKARPVRVSGLGARDRRRRRRARHRRRARAAHDRDRPGPQRHPRALGQPPARVGLAGAGSSARRGRAAAGRAPRPAPAAGGRRRAPRRPLPGVLRTGGERPRPARVRGALPAPGGARDATWRPQGLPPRDRLRAAGRARRQLARLAPVRAHRGPAPRVRGDRRRPRRRAADAAAADGRGRLR